MNSLSSWSINLVAVLLLRPGFLRSGAPGVFREMKLACPDSCSVQRSLNEILAVLHLVGLPPQPHVRA